MARAERHEVTDDPVSPDGFRDLYERQWWPMLRLAVGLVDDTGSAEDVVQDAFAAVYRRWDAIREPAAAVGYLRTAVVNNARSVLRRRMTARKHLHAVAEETTEGADASTILSAEHEMVRQAAIWCTWPPTAGR